MVVHTGDPLSQRAVRANALRRFLSTLTRLTARAVITDTPCDKPELLPFPPEPVDALAAYESSWRAHLKLLTETLNTV